MKIFLFPAIFALATLLPIKVVTRGILVLGPDTKLQDGTIQSMTQNIKNNSFLLDGETIVLRYRRVRRAKGIRIQIATGHRVVVTGPLRASFRSLEHFFILHKHWAEKKLRYFQQFPNPSIQLSPVEYRQKKERARVLVHEKLTYWNQRYGYAWKRVTIRNQSTRWGSCSSAGTLSFHAGLVDLPERLQDYLIVHELCHLRAMNHGEQFWNLVQKALPDARTLDRQLKHSQKNPVL